MYQYIWEHHKTIRLTSSQAIEAKERDRDRGLQKGEKQFTGRWEEQMFGK